MSREKIVDLVKAKLKELKKRGKLTEIEQVDSDILKIFIDGDMFGHFSIGRGKFIGENDEFLCSALADEAGALAI